MFRTILVLGRVSNLPTVWANTVAAWFLAGGDWDERMLWAALAGSLLYIGGMTLNDAFDGKWDKEHGKDRPIAQGKISANLVWVLGFLQLLSGTAIFVLLAGAEPQWVAALLGAILLYNWLHKRFVGAMWIMGLCRALLFLSAASCVIDVTSLDQIAFFWAIALMAYTAGITYAAQGEDTHQTVRLLAAVLLWFPILLGLLTLVTLGEKDTLVLRIGVVVLYFGWLLLSYQKLPKVGAFVTSVIAGMVLLDAMAVSAIDLQAAAVCAACLPLTRLFQRFIPAT
ncbi:MAG: UbiA family prenyltransferase [Verrucomicrobiota bacterium]